MSDTESPSRATAVLEARRGRGWGPSALAENAGVGVDVVDRIEGGGDVTPEQEAAVRTALGIPPAPPRAAPGGRAAALDAHVRDVASRLPGTLFRPDVEGMSAAKGWSRQAHDDVVRVERGYLPWSGGLALVTGCCALLGLAVGGIAALLGAWSVGEVALKTFLPCMVVTVVLVAVAAVESVGAPHRADHDRLTAMAAQRKRLRRLGFVLSSDGITALRFRKGALASRTHPRSAFRRVRRKWHAGGTHVTVTVRLLGGKKVRMPWLANTPELEVLLGGYDAAIAAAARPVAAGGPVTGGGVGGVG